MTLRVGTFNARFLPHLPSNARRAAVLAARIRDGAYDLLVLTEVFSDRARRVLVGELAREYPWNVQSIGSRWILREDSGLMVLSRLPFDELPDVLPYRHPRIRASASGVAPDWPHVRFVEYGDCSSSDCLAGKGAGYVRVRYGGRPLNVFFTHMQAAYGYHGPRRQARTRQVRSAQLHQLTGLVHAALGTDRAATENTLMLGDLNVDGVRSGGGAGRDHEVDGIEWREMLGRLGTQFPGGLLDVWDRHAPLDDPGNTFPSWDPNARRDYVLLSAADADLPLAVHHVSLAWDLARPHNGGRHVSDHLGISVDLNLHQAGCHPLDALTLGNGAEQGTIDGNIRHPGGLQWHRVDRLGTVDVELRFPGADGGAALEVFCARDISRPLRPEAGNGLDGRHGRRRYTLTSETLIRVGRTRSDLSGKYSLRVHPAS